MNAFQLTDSELSAINEVFGQFDPSRSGKITHKEARIALRGLGYELSKQEFMKLLHIVEMSSTEYVRYEKFLDIVTQFLAQKHFKAEVTQLYKAILDIVRANPDVKSSHQDSQAMSEGIRQLDIQSILAGQWVSAKSITEYHLRRVSKLVNEPLSHEDIRDMMEIADLDTDGHISEEEFAKIMIKTGLWRVTSPSS